MVIYSNIIMYKSDRVISNLSQLIRLTLSVLRRVFITFDSFMNERWTFIMNNFALDNLSILPKAVPFRVCWAERRTLYNSHWMVLLSRVELPTIEWTSNNQTETDDLNSPLSDYRGCPQKLGNKLFSHVNLVSRRNRWWNVNSLDETANLSSVIYS